MIGRGTEVLGVIAALSQSIRLADNVRGVTKVTCDGRQLQPRQCIFETGIIGRPEHYCVVNGTMFMYPTPDKNYTVYISWDGHKGPAALMRCTQRWYDMYESELKLAQAECRVGV